MFTSLFEGLLESGLAYRYDMDRFEGLNGGGKPFPSPTRVVQTQYGPMIEELIQPTLSPVVIDRQTAQSLEELAHAVVSYTNAAMQLFSASVRGEINPEIAQIVGTSNEREMVNTTPGYSQVLPFIRLDCVRTPAGFKIVDFNSTRPGGVGEVPIVSKFYQERGCLGFPYDIERTFVQAVTEASDEWFCRMDKDVERVCDIAITEAEGDWQNMMSLASGLSREGWQVRMTDPHFGNLQAPVVIRGRIKEDHTGFSALSELYPDKACILSPLFRRYIGNKYWFYLVATAGYGSLFKALMGEQDYSTLLKTLPNTGIVSDGHAVFPDEVVPLSAIRRRDFITKTFGGSSAIGLMLGRSVTQTKWEQNLRERSNGVILQEYVPSKENHLVLDQTGQPKEVPLYTKYGLFILGGRLAGIEVFARPSPIVHGARDSYFSCVFKEEEI